MNKEERKHVKAVGSMDSAENAGALRSQRESLAESHEEEEMVQGGDLTEGEMEKLRNALRIITEKMDESSAQKALERMVEKTGDDEDEELDLVEGIF